MSHPRSKPLGISIGLMLESTGLLCMMVHDVSGCYSVFPHCRVAAAAAL